MIEPRVQVYGLKELRRDLKAVGDIEGLAQLRDGLKAAAEIGASEARSLASVFSDRAAQTIRPTAGGNKAYIAGGKASLPWYGWADFGSRTPISGAPRSVGPWAHSGRGPRHGRFIYEAIDRESERIADAVRDGVDRALDRHDL